MISTYSEFLICRQRYRGDDGFEPEWLPDWLFDFQRSLVEWAIKKGRAAIFADCGLGKTPMQLAWAENVIRKTGGNVLIMTPLAVSHQTCEEGRKFGIECSRTRGALIKGISVVNYEMLQHLDPTDYVGIVCDESSAIKNFDSKRTSLITDFMNRVPYRLLCTATAAPNDYHELGTSSEALGEMGYRDMITAFFAQETTKDHLGWGRTKYRFRGHAEHPFWRWVCSWARACRKPSDLGYDDGAFVLPQLTEQIHEIHCSKPRPGMLMALPARDIREQREERRLTIRERCERVAELVAGHEGASVCWAHLNTESDMLERMIPEAMQVKGSMSPDEKEEKLLAFSRGDLPVLITKPKIGCWGLNWQHCNNVVTFPSHSYEQYYQLVRRCWRFGQKKPVRVNIVTTDGELAVMRNLQRKSQQADRMFTALVREMNNSMNISNTEVYPLREEVPSWL